MNKYKPYPEYKESGVDWLEKIPDGWNSKKMKFLAKIQNGQDYKHVEVEDGVFPVIGSGGEFTRSNTYLYHGESVLLGRKGTIDKPLYINGKFWTVDTMFYTKISKNSHAKYLYYCALTIKFDMYSTNTALPSMTQGDLGNIHFATPEHSNQQQIASFLDHETGKIDKLICKQQDLIALLEEKRQAVISHAVTKGLDPNVPMKDSGVVWLGEVPEHWKVKRIKNVVTAIVDGPHFSPKYQDSGYMFISARNIKVDRWSLEDAKFISESDYHEFSKRVKPEIGDVLLTKGGTTGVARVVDLDFPFQVWVHVAVLKVFYSKIHSNYLTLSLNGSACYEQSQLFTRGATNNDLGLTRIANIFIASPPKNEQALIASFLHDKCNKIDSLILKSKSAIELMQERRTALISAAVTGKIDVRGLEKEKWN